MHLLYERTMLWDLIGLQLNPTELVKIKGASRRKRKPLLLTIEEYHALVGQFSDLRRTMVVSPQLVSLL
jgi:integrase